MAKIKQAPSKVTALELPIRISEEVIGWRNQGYHPMPSPTTKYLLDYWFHVEREGERFHPCQQLAIETIIYLHECRGVRVLKDVYEQFAQERLKLFKSVADEVSEVPFIKYCIKSATGSGKTWVLNALIVWQYFNYLNQESNAPYSGRFMIVTPGLEVRNRILDSLKGRIDTQTGKSGCPKPPTCGGHLFVPEDMEWKGRFDLLNHVLEPEDIRSNATPPDGAFVAVTNWQQFRLGDEAPSLAQQLGLDSPDEQPQGEIIADFMTEFPDLIVMNDEAHHVHGKKTVRADELIWRRFMDVLHDRMRQRHGKMAGAISCRWISRRRRSTDRATSASTSLTSSMTMTCATPSKTCW